MTAMEWILTVEMIVLAVLACLLLYFLLREGRGNGGRHNAGQRTEFVWYPDQKVAAYPQMQQGAGYGTSPYPSRIEGAGRGTRNGDPAPFRGYENGYGNAFPNGYGTGYPNGYGAAFPNAYGNVSPNAFGNDYGNGLAYGMGARADGGMTYPGAGVERLYVPTETDPPRYGAASDPDGYRGAGVRDSRRGGHKRKSADRRSGEAGISSEQLRRQASDFLRGRPRWRVDLVDMSSGRHVTRDFRDRLIVGRQMPEEQESGKLYLSMDATVSRLQFCLFATDEGIMIENLSRVNVTRRNGYPVWQPVRLEEGDVLELGRMRYMVKELRPSA